MDMTVTAPLDMGTGQQRYVVAYTLKQGIEKQPDILNAQKSMSNLERFQSQQISIVLHEFRLLTDHFILFLFLHSFAKFRFR